MTDHSISGLEARHLRQLVVIADHGEIDAAARHLGVPARRLARRLSALEALVRAPLFEPGPTGLVPTARGAQVVHAARSVLADLALLVGPAARPAALRLAGVDALLAPTLRALAGSRPDLRLESRTASSSQAVADVLAGQADVAVAVRWPHAPWPSAARAHRVERRSLQLLVPDTHLLAGRAVVDLAELAADAWCLPTDPDCATAITAECRRAGLEPDARYRVSGEAELLDVVASGHAVALSAHPVRHVDGLTRIAYRGATAAEWMVAHRPDVDPGDLQSVVRALEQVASPAAPPVPTVDGGSIGTRERPLRLAVTPGLALPQQVGSRTGLYVTVVERDEVDLAPALDAGEVHAALHHSYAFLRDWFPPSWPRRVLSPDEPVLVAVAAARATGPLPVDELCRVPWAVPAAPAVQSVVHALCRLGGGEAEIAVVYEDPHEVAAAIARGDMVRLADPRGPAPGAVAVPVDHPMARRSTVLTWPPDSPMAALADAVTRELGRRTGVRRPVRMAG